MKHLFSALTVVFFIFIAFGSGDSDTSVKQHEREVEQNKRVEKEDSPYELMNRAFVGRPEISTIKPMLEAVLEDYNLPKTDDSRIMVGDILVFLRKNSAVGVTEMEILKDIYQNGSNQIPFKEQAALSATYLEFI